jgi:transposase
LSDSKNNKLLAWIPWIKSGTIIKKLKIIPRKIREQIKEVSVDMSNWMEKIARKSFKNAIIVTDRFHVRKLVNDMVWWLKTRLKVKLNREINKLKKKYKKYKIKKYVNGESRIEMITRAHYQIRKNRKNWNSNQIKRWNIMKKLQYFKWIIAIYEMSMELYEIYEQKINKYKATVLMQEWIKKARRYRRIPELLHLADSIEKRLDTITNYFVSRHSNGFWEWLNSRIWHIVRDNRWFANEDYMIFRFIKALW